MSTGGAQTCPLASRITSELTSIAVVNSIGVLDEVPHYKEKGIIGKGTFGLVVKAVDVRHSPFTCPEVAIKILTRGEFIRSYKTYVKREVVHQGSLKHPLIVRVKEVFLTSKYVGIVQEYVAGGDLHKYLRTMPAHRLSEASARWLFQQLIIALDFCHKRGVANRDLKLENLLLDGMDTSLPLLKICDFGYSKHQLNSSAKTSGIGTAVYMAPEVILGDEEGYDAMRADIWATGIILYAMLFGSYPFDVKHPMFMRKMINGEFSFPTDVQCCDGAKEIISALLRPNPAARATINDIMSHKWFNVAMPPGARDLNDQILRDAPQLEPTTAQRVGELIDKASKLGEPGESVISVVL